ncbi:MAG: DNA polymerase I [Coriobacteriales bacterium]|jgi:DNA polymerase-1|nr:DNA polymerase I [Coriobacteriales bacterium]
MRKIAVIDGNSLMHRAFHAVQTPMNAPDGRPTNACFGFLAMLLKFIEQFRPDAIICAFDAGIPQFRMQAIEQYKAQRPPTDPSLRQQFPIIEELLGAMAIPVIRIQGWEGDDILGSVAAMANKQDDCQTYLVSGDKDILQLVNENTFVVTTKMGMSDIIIYDADAVIQRFGVSPNLVIDYLGLMGDSSDNIPGVPGVGQKTATKLLQEYGSMDKVLQAAENIKGKLGENLRNNKAQALASREVATIICDVPLELDLLNISFPAFAINEISQIFGKYSLKTHMNKLIKICNGESETSQSMGLNSGNNSGNNTQKSVSVWQAEIDAMLALVNLKTLSGYAAMLALEDICNRHEEVGLHICEAQSDSLFASEPILYVVSNDTSMCFKDDDLIKALEHIIANAQWSAFSVKKILKLLYLKSDNNSKLAKYKDINVSRFFDCMLASYLIDSSKTYDDIFALACACLPEISYIVTSEHEADAFQSLQAGLALLLKTILQKKLEEDDSFSCYRNIEAPLIPVLLQMEQHGVKVDAKTLQEMSSDFQSLIDDLKKSAWEAAGEEFNLDSPKQLSVVLFEKLKLPARKKTSSGYSTDASVLAELAAMSPLPSVLPKVMIEYRELAKLKNTYLDALPKLIVADGHIHTSFNQAVTATGRLSSSDPNLQNIPVRSDLGRKIRSAFVADANALGVEEAVILTADYSQIELRLLAHLSADEHLVSAFVQGEDFHTQTAARLFGVKENEVSPQMRSRAKAVNFGIVYGQQAYGLSQSLGIPFEEAQEMINRYFVAFPGVRRYLDDLVAQAHDQGWVQTLYGRKRHIHELQSSNQALRKFGERTAMNHPMQGTAADIIKLAMIEVNKRLCSEGFVSQMILQVHDELDFNCAMDECERMSAMVKQAMEGVATLKVPLLVEVSYAKNWALAH